LIYDANACLNRTNEHEDEETWIEQNLLVYTASTDPDTMYHHQAMKQPDREKFQEAMKKECEAHYKDDVIAMSSVYYSRDIGVKSLALFLLSSNLLVRLKPWASAKRG
jgi:hypothetical protein